MHLQASGTGRYYCGISERDVDMQGMVGYGSRQGRDQFNFMFSTDKVD